MKPVNFPEANVTFAENQPEYLPLPAFKKPDDPNGQVITRWELSEAELAEIQETKSIIISVYTFNDPLQPLLPYVGESSFQEEPKEDPEIKPGEPEEENVFSKVASNIVHTIRDMRHPKPESSYDWISITQNWKEYLKKHFVAIEKN